MTTLETLKKQKENLRIEFKENNFKTRVQYNLAVKKWNNLSSKIKNYNNSTNIMKRDGLKVSKQGVGYKVEFKGIEAIIFEDACDTIFWSIDVIKGSLKHDLYSEQHQTKKEAIWFLYQIINNN